jgi:6-pyruvoyltetrahydropterin/6-carboxytetrahydropterin synthase
MEFTIGIDRHRLHFSAAHITIVEGKKAEALHGHNFEVSVEVGSEILDKRGMLIDFYDLLRTVESLLDEWDHFVLLPGNSPELSIRDIDGKSTEWVFAGKRYRVPKEDAVVLPVSNTTAEELAQLLATRVLNKLREEGFAGHLTWVRATVYEYPWLFASAKIPIHPSN